MRPFRLDVPEADLVDLRDRLARARWPDVPHGAAARREHERLRWLADRWAGSDWRAVEDEVNRWPHFLVDVDGVVLHVVHVRSRVPGAVPLVLTHGWPSSFLELLPLVPALTDPVAHGGDARDAFDVVIPSLPGFGWSSGPAGAGVVRRCPDLWVALVQDVLGYGRFAAHGSDIGAFVTNRLALEHPDALTGIHVTLLAEFRWTDRRQPVDPDQVLRAASLYWLTGTATSSVHAYADLALATAAVPVRDLVHPDAPPGADGRPLPDGRRIGVPAALLRTVTYDPPRSWAERAYADLRGRGRAPLGGHFLAAEQPEALVRDLRSFFRPLR